MAPLIVALVLALFAVILVASSVRVVRQARVGIVERWGKYRASLPPGLHLILPMLDRITAVVDMRETVQAFAPQPVITQDNVTIGIDTVVYYQVTDPFRATYEVANVLIAMEQLAHHHAAKRGRLDDARGHAHQPRRDQHPAADRAGRGHREVGRARDPGGAEEHRPAALDPGGDGAADARRPRQAGGDPVRPRARSSRRSCAPRACARPRS